VADEAFGKHLERQAEQFGLPTDPEAYQDGGLVEAASASSVPEADLIAAMLKDAGIPAWVGDANMSTLYGAHNYVIAPGGIQVLVPLGRLADAEKLLAEHQASPPLQEDDEAAPQPNRWVRFISVLLASWVLATFVVSLLLMVGVVTSFLAISETAILILIPTLSIGLAVVFVVLFYHFQHKRS